ncbi:hypothetical protein C1Y63_12440, partial [Corynebacterium sp. 13CS0277]|uniref:LGFP repeat-containing protein n=1 Tax=Corynebacterium sp. 13CS0277 TaxID=2071994 RepID=UPI000D3F3B71
MAAASLAPQVQGAEFYGHEVKGRILEAFHRVGGHARLGNATTGELDLAGGGKFQVFANNASIYWHPQIANGVAHQVGGRIRDKWSEFGWEQGRYGYPITDELTPPDGYGRFNHFERGSIYWTPRTDAHAIEGRIRDRWEQDGWETGRLGYPTTDELTPPDGVGRFNHFENGSIYWTPSTGAHIVA